MTGALWAAAAGIGFGFFQAFNRRAGRGFDAYKATLTLILVSVLILSAASFLTEDLSLLGSAPPRAYVNFGLAGLIHFNLGWTLLTISQDRIGAARTGALVGATPLFATVVGLVAFGEVLSLPVLLGILTVVGGVYLVSLARIRMSNTSHPDSSLPLTINWRSSLYALGTALCFSISAIFIRAGLSELPSPLLGVTAGMLVSAGVYSGMLLLRGGDPDETSPTSDALLFQLLAGVLVGLSTWMRWLALDMAEVGVVLALGRLNVPLVILVSPLLVGRKQEQVTARVWLGAGLIVLGSLILIFF